MKKLIIGASVGLISTLSLGDVVKDILNTEVPQQNKEIQIINKFDIYQCGHDKNGSFDFRKWMTCLNTKSSVPSRFNYPDRTNDLYSILVKDYGLNTRVQCKIYSSDFGLSVDEKTKIFKQDIVENKNLCFEGLSIDKYRRVVIHGETEIELTYKGYMDSDAQTFFGDKVVYEERDGCSVVGAFIKMTDGTTKLASKGDAFVKTLDGRIRLK